MFANVTMAVIKQKYSLQCSSSKVNSLNIFLHLRPQQLAFAKRVFPIPRLVRTRIRTNKQVSKNSSKKRKNLRVCKNDWFWFFLALLQQRQQTACLKIAAWFLHFCCLDFLSYVSHVFEQCTCVTTSLLRHAFFLLSATESPQTCLKNVLPVQCEDTISAIACFFLLIACLCCACWWTDRDRFALFRSFPTQSGYVSVKHPTDAASTTLIGPNPRT